MTKIGVFGGSFDPPHLSHLAVGTFALALTGLDRVMVIPVFDHALSKSLTPFDHRFRMCELTFADLRRIEVSDLERELGGVSYTLNTLEHLSEAHPDWELTLIVGADAMRERDSWYRFDRINELAEVTVFGRAGVELDQEGMLPAPPSICSTELRRKFRAGEGLDGLVPRPVLRYIEANRLYQEG